VVGWQRTPPSRRRHRLQPTPAPGPGPRSGRGWAVGIGEKERGSLDRVFRITRSRSRSATRSPSSSLFSSRPLSPLSKAFRSEADKTAALESCRASVAANCEAGARFGAGVAAAATCATARRRGFWRVVVGRVTGRGPRLAEERAACEAREAEVRETDGEREGEWERARGPKPRQPPALTHASHIFSLSLSSLQTFLHDAAARCAEHAAAFCRDALATPVAGKGQVDRRFGRGGGWRARPGNGLLWS